MTETLVQSPSYPAAAAQPGIPGISAAELDAMQTAAARFLATRNAGPAVETTVASDLQALTRPAGPLAAGVTSALRDEYRKVRDAHFMLMTPPAV